MPSRCHLTYPPDFSARGRREVEERDACGVGFIASKKNQRSHEILSRALHALGCMEHRGGCGGDGVSGDGTRGGRKRSNWQQVEREVITHIYS